MSKKQLLAAAVVAALSTGMIASNMTSAFAADDSASTKTRAKTESADQKTKAAENDLVKVSDDALTSMRDVNSARLAIFNGDPVQAQTYVDAAVTRINAAARDADKFALDIKAPKEKDRYVPFGASFAVLDTFEPNDAKAKHIAKANEHLHKGEQKKALEALKLGEINVAISTDLIPVKFAMEHIAQAAKLVGEAKYYEANLALKAVNDAAIVQTYSVDGVPKTKADAAKKAKD